MSISYDIENYIATHNPEKYEQFKKLKYGIKNLNIINPFNRIDEPDVQIARLVLDSRYSYFTCKHILNINLMPFQGFIIDSLYNHARPLLIATRGAGKTFLLGLYALYRAFIKQGSKVIVVGSGFRQSKMIMEVCEKIWYGADVLRDILGRTGLAGEENGVKYAMDKITMTVGQSQIVALPIGVGGQKIRGFRSNVTIADEFDAHILDVFERVIRGFGVVSEDPAEKVRTKMAFNAAIRLGISPAKMGISLAEDFNQEIIAGTASYADSNLGQYYKKHKAIIEARGRIEKLKELMPEDWTKFADVDPKHYCVFRIPYNLLPEGYMSKIDIDSARATSSDEVFQSEYGTVFLNDSTGFYKKSLIDACTTNSLINGIEFMPLIKGKADAEYVIGVDPASEKDNLGIVVLEVYKGHKRIVACFTMTRANFEKDKADSRTIEKRFYAYAAKRIRKICDDFGNVIQIGMDAEGGGREIRDELLSLKDPIYEVVELGDIKQTDILQGPHILKLVKFQDYQWVSSANHTMKRDMENKTLLFPKYDPYQMMAEEELSGKGAGFERYKNVSLMNREVVEDTIEYVYDEIEILKKELTSIIRTESATGRERWGLPSRKGDTPEEKEHKKDRYSALLIANAVANEVTKSRDFDTSPDEKTYGKVMEKSRAKRDEKKAKSTRMYYGSNPFINRYNEFRPGVIKRDSGVY